MSLTNTGIGTTVGLFHTRFHFNDLAENITPDLADSGIRCHNRVTAFFLSWFGKCITVEQADGTVTYLNTNSYQKWVKKHSTTCLKSENPEAYKSAEVRKTIDLILSTHLIKRAQTKFDPITKEFNEQTYKAYNEGLAVLKQAQKYDAELKTRIENLEKNGALFLTERFHYGHYNARFIQFKFADFELGVNLKQVVERFEKVLKIIREVPKTSSAAFEELKTSTTTQLESHYKTLQSLVQLKNDLFALFDKIDEAAISKISEAVKTTLPQLQALTTGNPIQELQQLEATLKLPKKGQGLVVPYLENQISSTLNDKIKIKIILLFFHPIHLAMVEADTANTELCDKVCTAHSALSSTPKTPVKFPKSPLKPKTRPPKIDATGILKECQLGVLSDSQLAQLNPKEQADRFLKTEEQAKLWVQLNEEEIKAKHSSPGNPAPIAT